ncbi:MAG: hypothetical protein JWQ98_3575 [Chlorobi bacterium]|jgi:hypothetical protein|nr:hypothetical protein [Chlorobiota bacterium]
MSGKGYYIAQFFVIVTLITISLSMAGCDVIGGIFKAGIWTGLILIVVLVGVVALIARMFKK